METAKKFEIHYFLQNDSHSMDAIIKNQCEAEFLAIAYEIINQFDFDITLNAEALSEGGLRAIWDAFGNNEKQTGLLLMLLTAIFTYKSIPDSELVSLQKSDIKLSIVERGYSIEEKKLNIEKIKKESTSEVSKETINSAVEIANENPKIVTRKSNFYKKILQNQQVNKIGFSSLDKNQKPVGNESIIKRSDFVNHIMKSNKLPAERIDDARIKILSPILGEGNGKWKGLYENNNISFYIVRSLSELTTNFGSCHSRHPKGS